MFDCLIHNALVLTLEPGAFPLVNGYVAVQGSRIAAVGQPGVDVHRPGAGATSRTGCSGAQCAPYIIAAVGQVGAGAHRPEAGATIDLPPARDYLDARGGLVMPGLVNTHCHAPMVWFRGLADDLPLQQWLQDFIFPAEVGWLNPDRVYWGAILAAAELIRGGVTTVGDSYFYETQARRALAQAGLRAVVAQGVVDFPAPGVPDPRDNLKVAAEFVETGRDVAPGRITSTIFCHAPYTCGPETLRGAKAMTRERGLPFFIHLAETRREPVDLEQRTGQRPVAYLDGLGVLDELTVAVHCVWLEPEEQDLLARRGVKVSHCPDSNLKLASGVAPIPELLAQGVAVGLGTDGAASNNNLNMWGEMSLAARLHKVWRSDPTVLPASRVLALATREGARVLGLEDRCGTLTPGQEADLIVLDLNRPHLTPMFDPYSHLVYAAGPGDVVSVMAAGRWLMRDRRLLTIDWEEVARHIRAGSRELVEKFKVQSSKFKLNSR